MPEIKDSFTKTIGTNANSFGIFQITLDFGAGPGYNGSCWKETLGISLSLLQVNHNNTNPTVSIRQYISPEDLRELSMLLWHAERAYESRKKETEERKQGEAANETPA